MTYRSTTIPNVVKKNPMMLANRSGHELNPVIVKRTQVLTGCLVIRRIDDDHVDTVRPDERFGDLERLCARQRGGGRRSAVDEFRELLLVRHGIVGMAERGLAKVALSLTTLDRRLARAMEPRATAANSIAGNAK